ncbi:MAG: 4-hydroxy-tetrahydrodipicolinate reductase [Chlamydiales bacterium]
MKIGLIGYGKMNRLVESLAKEHEICARITSDSPLSNDDLAICDLFIDFSTPSAVMPHIKRIAAAKKKHLIGTTGWDSIKESEEIVEQCGSAALFAPNFSLGMALFIQLLEEAKKLLPQFATAGVEYHHCGKADTPSGTAREIGKRLNIEFSSVRLGSIVGIHEVIFDSPVERISLKHEAQNRSGFALGAIQAAEWLIDKTGWYTLHDMLRTLYGLDHAFQK